MGWVENLSEWFQGVFVVVFRRRVILRWQYLFMYLCVWLFVYLSICVFVYGKQVEVLYASAIRWVENLRLEWVVAWSVRYRLVVGWSRGDLTSACLGQVGAAVDHYLKTSLFARHSLVWDSLFGAQLQCIVLFEVFSLYPHDSFGVAIWKPQICHLAIALVGLSHIIILLCILISSLLCILSVGAIMFSSSISLYCDQFWP